jgi:hypothetical protein
MRTLSYSSILFERQPGSRLPQTQEDVQDDRQEELRRLYLKDTTGEKPIPQEELVGGKETIKRYDPTRLRFRVGDMRLDAVLGTACIAEARLCACCTRKMVLHTRTKSS